MPSWDIDQLIEELRKLVGWGSTAHRLPAMHALRVALGVSPDLPHAHAGRMMRQVLLARIRDLDGSFTVANTRIEALQVKLALQVSFAYDLSACNAPTRRTAAMRHVGVRKSVRSWQYGNGGEVKLLTILAEHLLGGGAQQPNCQTA